MKGNTQTKESAMGASNTVTPKWMTGKGVRTLVRDLKKAGMPLAEIKRAVKQLVALTSGK